MKGAVRVLSESIVQVKFREKADTDRWRLTWTGGGSREQVEGRREQVRC